MVKPAMTRKERLERALALEDVDRLPFWVKIFGPYRTFQDEPYRSMDELTLADELELDHLAGGPSTVVRKNDRVEQSVQDDGIRRVVEMRTPDGTLTQVDGFDERSRSRHPIEFPIKTFDDLRAARHVFEAARFETSPELLERAEESIRAVGDRGIVMTWMGISPLMNLIQHLAGPENTYFFLADHPDEMNELIGLMHDERLRYLRCLLSNCPYDYIMSVENTSTTLLSPAVFERYCWRHLNDYGRLIRAAGKHHLLHMCGHLKALLPRINELPATAIEAYTTPPVGNTSIADRGSLCPTKSIIGGTDATLWLQPAEAICATIERGLAEAGGTRGVVLTSAGEMPPIVPVDRIRAVRQFLMGIPGAG